MAVPRLASEQPFWAVDPEVLPVPPQQAASIGGASRHSRPVDLGRLEPVDLVVVGSVAVSSDGRRLGKGGGFSDLEYAVATVAGLIGPRTPIVTTVHELQVLPSGTIPVTAHDVFLDLIVTPERTITCTGRGVKHHSAGIVWDELTDEKVASIPLLRRLQEQDGD